MKNYSKKILSSSNKLLKTLLGEFRRMRDVILPEGYSRSQFNEARRQFLADHGYIPDRQHTVYGTKKVERAVKPVEAATMTAYDKYVARLEAEEKKTGRDLSSFKSQIEYENRTQVLFDLKKEQLSLQHPDWTEEQLNKMARSHNAPRDTANSVIYPTSASKAGAIQKAVKKALEEGNITKEDYDELFKKSMRELRKTKIDNYRELMDELGISNIYRDLVMKGMTGKQAAEWMRHNIFGSK